MGDVGMEYEGKILKTKCLITPWEMESREHDQTGKVHANLRQYELLSMAQINQFANFHYRKLPWKATGATPKHLSRMCHYVNLARNWFIIANK